METLTDIAIDTTAEHDTRGTPRRHLLRRGLMIGVAVIVVAYATVVTVRLAGVSSERADTEQELSVSEKALETARDDLVVRDGRVEDARRRAAAAEADLTAAEHELDAIDKAVVASFVEFLLADVGDQITPEAAQCFGESLASSLGSVRFVELALSTEEDPTMSPEEEVAVARAGLDCLPAEVLAGGSGPQRIV